MRGCKLWLWGFFRAGAFKYVESPLANACISNMRTGPPAVSQYSNLVPSHDRRNYLSRGGGGCNNRRRDGDTQNLLRSSFWGNLVKYRPPSSKTITNYN